MPFLHLMNMLRLQESWKKIQNELEAAYGVTKKCLLPWRLLYQGALGSELSTGGPFMVGGPNCTVVCDETVVGVDNEDGWSAFTRGVNKKGNPQIRGSRQNKARHLVRKGALKQLPARTVYKGQRIQKRTSVLKETAEARKERLAYSRQVVRKKPAALMEKKANLKNAGRWLWFGILVGQGSTVCTHSNGLKRVAFRLLPHKILAQNNKPRGLGEITDTLRLYVRKGSFLVHDAWSSTIAAVKRLGYKSPPAVRHDRNYRDSATGFHTNDAESENARIKSWSRSRYGHLHLNENELHEYVYYINIGNSLTAVMAGLAKHGGGKAANQFV